MRIIDLLNKIANGEEVPTEIKYGNVIYWYDETDDNEIARYKDKGGEWLFADCYLNNTVEILEEENKEFHANNLEFCVDNSKTDLVITLDENDLGIDKLHFDNCYFFKGNDGKWYVRKYEFKTIEEENKIEKLKINLNIDDENKVNYYRANNLECDLAFKINEIIDEINKLKEDK